MYVWCEKTREVLEIIRKPLDFTVWFSSNGENSRAIAALQLQCKDG